MNRNLRNQSSNSVFRTNFSERGHNTTFCLIIDCHIITKLNNGHFDPIWYEKKIAKDGAKPDLSMKGFPLF